MIKSLIFVLLTSFFISADASYVVVNKDVQADELTREEVRAVFTLRKHIWADGSSIKVLVLPNQSIITKDFLYQILKMPPTMYFDILDANYNSGRGSMPKVVESEKLMLLNISITPGSIGYIYETELLKNISNIKILRVK